MMGVKLFTRQPVKLGNKRGNARINICEFVFLALAIQHAQRIQCFILPSVACPALPNFPSLSHKPHDLKELALLIQDVRKSCTFFKNSISATYTTLHTLGT